MKTIIVIPARYKSSRLPGKPLIKLNGKPMIQWVLELCSKAIDKEHIYVATDDNRIFNFVTSIGYKSVMTSENCLTGTDRLAEVAKKINSDIYINVQGDEPIINPEDIKKIINAKIKYPNDVINGYTKIEISENPESVNIPKVIFTEEKQLIYISRKTLPGFKNDKNQPKEYFKQVCIYAFNREELNLFGSYKKKSILEESEDIEILRFFEFNKKIRLVQAEPGSLAVDTLADIEKVEKALKEMK